MLRSDDNLMYSVPLKDEAYLLFPLEGAFLNPPNIISFEIRAEFCCRFFVDPPQKLNRDIWVWMHHSNNLTKSVVEPFTDVVCARF